MSHKGFLNTALWFLSGQGAGIYRLVKKVLQKGIPV